MLLSRDGTTRRPGATGACGSGAVRGAVDYVPCASTLHGTDDACSTSIVEAEA